MPSLKFSKLLNTRILIIGGTSGIGFAVAEGSLESSASIIIYGSNSSRLSSALSRLRSAYPEASFRISGTTCDVSDEATVEGNLHALFKFATSDGKKIDHVVSTAGTSGRAKLADTPATEVLKTGALRYLSAMMVGKIAPAYMEDGPGASILFTGGAAATKPGRDLAITAGWVTATEGLTRCLAIDLAPRRINLVNPGLTRTERTERMGLTADAVLQKLGRDSLLGAIGEPEDAAEAYLFCMKDRFLTGALIATDGGRLLAAP